MAIAQKYDTTATTKTHGLVDASISDLIFPSAPLDQTGNYMRAGVHILGGWLARGYKENGSFGL